MEEDLILFLHLGFAFLLVTGSSMALYGEVNAGRTDDPKVFRAHIGLGDFGGKLAGASAVLASIFGTILAWRGGWSLTEGWLLAAYATAIVAVIVPPLTLVRQMKRVMALMPEAEKAGAVLAEQKAILHGGVMRGATACMWLHVVFIMVDMAFKPF